MSEAPGTTNAEKTWSGGIDWDDHAAVQKRRDRDVHSTVLHDFTILRQGRFADMVRFVARLPEDDRDNLVIEKAGDRLFEVPEILELSRRDDFPG